MATCLFEVYNAYLNAVNDGGNEKAYSIMYAKAFPILYKAGYDEFLDEHKIRCCLCGEVISRARMDILKTYAIAHAACSEECAAKLLGEEKYGCKEDYKEVNKES